MLVEVKAVEVSEVPELVLVDLTLYCRNSELQGLEWILVSCTINPTESSFHSHSVKAFCMARDDIQCFVI